MQIQSGKLYENRTWRYLYPCLKNYGMHLINYLSSFIKLGIGIGDNNVKTERNSIFILIQTDPIGASDTDRQNYKRNFSKFLDWLRYQPFYVKDYVYEDLDSAVKHMVVLKIPPKHNIAYDKFVKGKYSEMYSKEEINAYFNIMNNDDNNPVISKRNERVSLSRKILTRDSKHLPVFVETVNKDFGTDIVVEDFKDAELDYPIKLQEEIFSYGREQT